MEGINEGKQASDGEFNGVVRPSHGTMNRDKQQSTSAGAAAADLGCAKLERNAVKDMAASKCANSNREGSILQGHRYH
jgi:hypothetical protein